MLSSDYVVNHYPRPSNVFIRDKNSNLLFCRSVWQNFHIDHLLLTLAVRNKKSGVTETDVWYCKSDKTHFIRSLACAFYLTHLVLLCMLWYRKKYSIKMILNMCIQFITMLSKCVQRLEYKCTQTPNIIKHTLIQ